MKNDNAETRANTDSGLVVTVNGRRILPNRMLMDVRHRSGVDYVVLVEVPGAVHPYVTGLVAAHRDSDADIREWFHGCYHDDSGAALKCLGLRADGGFSGECRD